SLRQLLLRYLTSLGHDVDAVPDGTTAVSALGGTRYDVIVTDVIMPGHNGLEVLRAAKEFDRLTEVIVLTGAPDLSTAVKALREGDAYDYIVKPFPNVEILRATVERAAERRVLRQQVDRLQRELQRQATTDSLTGSLNRRAFFELGEREFARAARHHEPLALAMVDVDRFKNIEEQFGPASGDAIVTRLAQVIKEQMRTEDLVGRYWADKFVCLMPATAPDDALRVAERIRGVLAASDLEVGDARIPVRISAGVAARQDADRSLDTLVRRAERALRRSKDQGGNRVAREQ
ncbi:MAG: diguanylate cyclase, partial [Dehalococcoidia bacterium]|nr:diguanylate cyclase [Dehalococcoidia bacterium]